jgi:capsular exopolysaccharide synthesis family protein
MSEPTPQVDRFHADPRRPGPSGSQTDPPPHFLDQLSTLYRYRYIAVTVFLLVVLSGVLRSYSETPLYEASARLMIEMEDDNTVAMAGAMDATRTTYWHDPKIYYETQYRILTGTELAKRVIKRLDLRQAAEFNPGESAAPPTESAMVARLLANVVVRPVPNSSLVNVAFRSADPSFAALGADTIADEYVQQNMELRRASATKSLEWLSKELQNQQKTVEASERALAEYREDQNALSLEGRQNIVVARLNHLNDSVTKAKTTRLQKEALFNQVAAADSDFSAETIPAILQNPYIQTVKTELAGLQREKAELLERYGEKYPAVIKVRASIQDASQRLQDELAKAIAAIRSDYQSAVAEEQTLTAALEAQKKDAADLSRKSVGYGLLEREANSNRQVYEALLLREKELQVMANSRGNNVRVTDRAEKPSAPFTATLRRNVTWSVGAGIALALTVVLVLSHLHDTIASPEDVTKFLQVPLLGLTPKVSGSEPPLLSNGVSPQFGEAFRSVRTSLIFNSGSDPTRIVMVTSGQPLEGKTTTACNLAVALAMDGARVLLVDADMRRPGVSRMLAASSKAGLSHVLAGQVSMGNAIVTLENPRLSVLTAGATPPNPSELLGSRRMKTLLEDVRGGEYDWVIIDTPPVLAVTDAVLLSPLVSMVAFVVSSEKTRRQHGRHSLEVLSNSGISRIGVVLNRVDFKRNKYYYNRLYGYESASYSYGNA